MVLLSAPFDSAAAAPPRPPLRPFAQTGGAAALVVALGAASEMLGAAPAGLGRALATGAAHGGLIGLGWLLATSGAPGWSGPVVRLGVAMTLASVAARLVPWGALAFALMPLLLLLEVRRRPALRALGLVGCRPRHSLAGLAAGGFLGAHLLITASLTFGHRAHTSSLAAYALALAYDVGANALSAEWLFRGAVFSWRGRARSSTWAWSDWSCAPSGPGAEACCPVTSQGSRSSPPTGLSRHDRVAAWAGGSAVRSHGPHGSGRGFRPPPSLPGSDGLGGAGVGDGRRRPRRRARRPAACARRPARGRASGDHLADARRAALPRLAGADRPPRRISRGRRTRTRRAPERGPGHPAPAGRAGSARGRADGCRPGAALHARSASRRAAGRR